MAKIEIRAGVPVGWWTPLYREGDRWQCKCKCGVEKSVLSFALRSGDSTKCRNCADRLKRKPDLIEIKVGIPIGWWTPLHPEGKYWRCRCKCGVEKKVKSTDLRSGGSTKCKACHGRTRRKVEYVEIKVRVPIGWWVPLYQDGKYWECRCKCGTKVKVLTRSLRAGISKKCRNCAIKETAAKGRAGKVAKGMKHAEKAARERAQRSGETILYLGSKGDKKSFFIKCNCGFEREVIASTAQIRQGVGQCRSCLISVKPNTGTCVVCTKTVPPYRSNRNCCSEKCLDIHKNQQWLAREGNKKFLVMNLVTALEETNFKKEKSNART